jgi:hypothetical protein
MAKIEQSEAEVFESPVRYIFEAKSTKGEAHVVDLLAFDGLGECSCQHFQFRIMPLVRRGLIEKGNPLGHCKHIRRAREKFCDMALEAYSRTHGE